MGASGLYRVGIVGATGYAGGELIRILLDHPNAELCWAGSLEDIGKRLDERYPSLRGRTDLCIEEPSLEVMRQCHIVFFATPHGVAMHYVPDLLDAGVKVIDLSADFRIQDIANWEKWYGMPHKAPHLVSEAVYGLPERNRAAMVGARLIACAGCYPTAAQLALLPAIEAGIIETDTIVIDAKSGVSGAGRQAKPHLLMTERLENFCAYSVTGHRHQPEIEQGLSLAGGQPVSVTFVPHLVPMARGIEETIYATLTQEVDLDSLYAGYYRDEPFVDFLSGGQVPETRDVRGSNFCRLSVCRPQNGKRVVLVSVIDNLVKGAAGQAVQCMNIMLQLPETTGLTTLSAIP